MVALTRVQQQFVNHTYGRTGTGDASVVEQCAQALISVTAVTGAAGRNSKCRGMLDGDGVHGCLARDFGL